MRLIGGNIVLCFLVYVSCTSVNAEQNTGEELSYWYRNFDHKATYDILALVLEKTQHIYGETIIKRSAELTQGRAIVELESASQNVVRLISVVADDSRNNNIIPIKIALDDGLIGLRVCIINKTDIDMFKDVKSHADIEQRGIVFGQGSHWPDATILRSNSLPVVVTARFENLFPMLKRKRFNCFLRGVSEAVADIEKYGDDELMIEPSLLFSYPSSSLFFVNKKDKALAARIELGLRRAILDGSFSAYFKDTFFKDLKRLNLDERRVIRLNNPLLTNETIKKTSERLSLSDGKIDVY